METTAVSNLLSTVPVLHVALPDGSVAEVESSVNTMCALAIVRGVSSFSDLSSLLLNPVLSFAEWERVMKIVNVSVRTGGDGGARVDIPRIMRDNKYAMHVQEVLGSLAPAAVSKIINSSIQGHILELSVDSFGCRVVQKLIEVAPCVDDSLAIVHPELSFKIIDCTMDVNGNHVVQKLIDTLPSGECQFIVDAILSGDNLKRLANHCFGCRVIQRLISKCKPAQTHPLLEALCGDPTLIAALASDAFGNYVLQHAIEYGRPEDRERIIVCIATMDVVALCCCKFASNVVEKAIRSQNKPSLATPSSVLVVRLLITALLAMYDGEEAILTLMKDRYGNYVVRAIVELTNPELALEVHKTTKLIVENAQSLKKFTFSWHLVERLGKRNIGL